MNNIRCFDNSGKIDPTALLKMAEDWGMTEVVIIGVDGKGERMWGSSNDAVRDILLHIKWAEFKLLMEAFE